MMMDRKQNLRDDIMSDCRSLGSNHQPCSQSRKISIGIVVDKSDKTRPNNVREDVAVVQTTGNLTSSKVNSKEDAHEKEKLRDPREGKQAEAPEKVTSPWVPTRFFHEKGQSSEAVHHTNQGLNLPSTITVFKQPQRSNEAKGSQGQYTVQFTANKMSILQSGDGQQKKFNTMTYGRKGERDASAARVEEFSFATAQEVIAPDNEVAEEKTSNIESKGSETLKMKLWEVLGTVTSPAKQSSNSQNLRTGTCNLESHLKSAKKANPVVKPRQNSDPIESDSDSPNDTMRRPVTRSLTRKRPNTKVQHNKMTTIPSSSYKQKPPEKTTFSCGEGGSRRTSAAGRGGFSDSKRKKSERESSGIEAPCKVDIPLCNDADETRQTPDRSKTKLPSEKSSLFGSRMGRFSSFLSRESKDSHQSTVMEKTDKQGDIDDPTLQNNVGQEEDMVNPSLKTILDSQFDFHSPTLKMKKPMKTSYLGSLAKTNLGEQDVISPVEKAPNTEGIWSFRCFFTSSPDHYKKNEEMETSDDEGEHEDSPVAKSVPIRKESPTENKQVISSSEENDSESSDEGSPTEGPSDAETQSPEIATAQTPEFFFHPTKKRRIHEDVEVSGFTPTPASAKGTEEINGLSSELNQENGLASAVALFAMILERVKSKMKSMTSKKSAEILTSVATEIHSQLQNAESQIQTDVGKLTNMGKSKRKHLETRLQEQQEQLKVIYGKFRDEVNQHLQDCRSTIEGLEAHQIEFKGTVEKHKASHRKLLVQAEEAIESQLSDAQRRITAVNKSAREKMLQLKYVIAECLKEDIIS